MRRYRIVRQKDEWGCGVACVASLLGLSYAKARRRLVVQKGREIDAKPAGLSNKAIKNVLHAEHLNVTKARGQRVWPTGTIVFLSRTWGRYRGCGHYLLKVPEGWMDPYISYPGKPLRAGIRDRLPRGTGVQLGLVPEPPPSPMAQR